MTNFTLQWRDGSKLFETQVYADDWQGAEAHVLAIKRTGKIVGANATEVRLPAVGLIAAALAWWKDRGRRRDAT